MLYLVLGVVIILLFVLLYFSFNKLMMKKRFKDRKITPRKNTKKKNIENTWLNHVLSKLDTEQFELKLIHSGSPLGIDGITTYLVLKFLFSFCGIIIGIQLYSEKNVTQSIVFLIIGAVVGFFIVDLIIKQGLKSRVDKINDQLPGFLVNFDTYNKSGLMFEDILSTCISMLKGDFKNEVIRFNTQYAITKNFEDSLSAFILRLGPADVESLEVKLRQCYTSGIYDDIISDEKEMIEKKILNTMAKETKRSEVYLALAMGLLLTNLFLWVIYPLMKMITSSMGGVF